MKAHWKGFSQSSWWQWWQKPLKWWKWNSFYHNKGIRGSDCPTTDGFVSNVISDGKNNDNGSSKSDGNGSSKNDGNGSGKIDGNNGGNSDGKNTGNSSGKPEPCQLLLQVAIPASKRPSHLLVHSPYSQSAFHRWVGSTDLNRPPQIPPCLISDLPPGTSQLPPGVGIHKARPLRLFPLLLLLIQKLFAPFWSQLPFSVKHQQRIFILWAGELLQFLGRWPWSS